MLVQSSYTSSKHELPHQKIRQQVKWHEMVKTSPSIPDPKQVFLMPEDIKETAILTVLESPKDRQSTLM